MMDLDSCHDNACMRRIDAVNRLERQGVDVEVMMIARMLEIRQV